MTLNTPDDQGEAWQIQIPDLSPKESQMMDIDSIAFEFDESWNRDIPKSYGDLMCETSARGFLSCSFTTNHAMIRQHLTFGSL
jgi:hypothetical protein